MPRFLVVAWYEFVQTVLSKTFLLTLLLMPVIFGAMFLVTWFTRDGVDIRDRAVVVVDSTGRLGAAIAEASERRNRDSIHRGEGSDRRQVRPRFVVEVVDAPADEDATARNRRRAELSDRIRADELFAWVEIGASALDPDATRGHGVAYHSDAPTYDPLPDWLRETIDESVRDIRVREAGLDRDRVRQLLASRPFERLGLVDVDESGRVLDAEKEDPIATRIVPFALLMILYFAANLSAPLMLTSVVEEKANRVAEMLAAAAPPGELLAGKLLATTARGLVFAGTYVAGGVGLLVFGDRLGLVTPGLLGWFLVYVVLVQLMFGAIFGGIGAACGEMKDAQNFTVLTLPLTFGPILLVGPVLQSPDSAFSVAMSLVPPFTPFLMMLRQSVPPGPPLWQVIAGLAGALAFTVACVWAGGRVFRVGLLAQGATPKLGTLLRWVVKG